MNMKIRLEVFLRAPSTQVIRAWNEKRLMCCPASKRLFVIGLLRRKKA